MKNALAILTVAGLLLIAGYAKPPPPANPSVPVVKPPATLQINSNLTTLSKTDLQCVTRDALSRFTATHAAKRIFRLAGRMPVDFYYDSNKRPGTFDWDTDFKLKNTTDKFGDYTTLPASVRSFVLNENDHRKIDGQFPLPLDLKEVIWSKRERKIQVQLIWVQTISGSYTFLYKVKDNGEIVFLRSVGMGCSETDPGYFIEEKPPTPSVSGRP